MLFYLYLVIINLMSFYAVRSDKKRALFSRYKFGERTLLIFAVLGGSPGVLVSIHYYKYLNTKPAFRIGIPVIFALQIILLLLYIMR